MGFTLNQHEQEKQIKRLQQKEDHDTTNYNDLDNLPQINSVELKGDKSLSDLGIQAELTFDDTPTDGSNNPVKSDGVYDADNSIYEVMGRTGAKNLLTFPYDSDSYDNHDVHFVVNGDGTVTVTTEETGATANTTFVLWSRPSNNLILKKGTYLLTGCPSGGGDQTYIMQGGNTGISPAINIKDTGNGTQFSLSDELPIGLWITIASGYINTEGLIFKPMIRLVSDTDPTYRPYAKTNKQLTDDITGITPHILPDAPTTDGSYNLKVTVTSGEAAYSWEAVTP